jgi:hypothetical protein
MAGVTSTNYFPAGLAVLAQGRPRLVKPELIFASVLASCFVCNYLTFRRYVDTNGHPIEPIITKAEKDVCMRTSNASGWRFDVQSARKASRPERL